MIWLGVTATQSHSVGAKAPSSGVSTTTAVGQTTPTVSAPASSAANLLGVVGAMSGSVSALAAVGALVLNLRRTPPPSL